MSGSCIVEVVRGGHVDCTHVVDYAVTGVPGSAAPVFLRSAAKPFQAIPAVAAGVLERFALGERELAIACASHTGRPEHVAAAAGILAAAGVDTTALQCGDDGGGGGLSHSCSGNHALGLALCVHEGWDTTTYLDAHHPLQEAMRVAVGEAAGERVDEALDGCGMRAYRVSLGGFAAMFGGLAVSAGAAGRCANAMRAHPDLVREVGAIDTELMRAVPGIVAKIGAEAVLGVGLVDGRGVALKVRDGGFRALDPAAIAVLRVVCGVTVGGVVIDRLAFPPVTNARGEVVGELRVSHLR